MNLYRLPVHLAVEVLTRRQWFYDFETSHPDIMGGAYHFWREELPKEPPHKLSFQKRYNRILDAMTGILSERHRGDFFREGPRNPRWWAVHGARLIGWDWQDFPLRYSLQADIEEICEAVSEMKEEELRQNIERVFNDGKEGKERYESERLRKWMREQLAPHLLPALRQFYVAARDEAQIVVYRLG